MTDVIEVITRGPQGPPGTAGEDGLSFRWRGGWQNGTAYSVGDAARGSDGSAYIAKQAHTAHNPVADVDAGTGEGTYWSLMAMHGAAGADGAQGLPGEGADVDLSALTDPIGWSYEGVWNGAFPLSSSEQHASLGFDENGNFTLTGTEHIIIPELAADVSSKLRFLADLYQLSIRARQALAFTRDLGDETFAETDFYGNEIDMYDVATGNGLYMWYDGAAGTIKVHSQASGDDGSATTVLGSDGTWGLYGAGADPVFEIGQYGPSADGGWGFAIQDSFDDTHPLYWSDYWWTLVAEGSGFTSLKAGDPHAANGYATLWSNGDGGAVRLANSGGYGGFQAHWKPDFSGVESVEISLGNNYGGPNTFAPTPNTAETAAAEYGLDYRGQAFGTRLRFRGMPGQTDAMTEWWNGGEAHPRFGIDPLGAMHWGDGTAEADAHLERVSAGVLGTLGSLYLGAPDLSGPITAISPGSAGLTLADDINTAYAAYSLTYLALGTGTGGQVALTWFAGGANKPGLKAGQAADVNFYRNAVDEWKTDDALVVELGVVLKSPDNSYHRIVVANDGTLSTVAA